MGLIKTGLKTAVAVKTAHVVHDRIQRRQQAEWTSQPVPGPAGPAGPAGMVTAHGTPASMAVVPAVAVASSAPSSAPLMAPGPVAVDRSKMLDELRQLGDLRSAGVLTDAEFETQKALVLGG